MLGLIKNESYQEILKELVSNPSYMEILLYIKENQQINMESLKEKISNEERLRTIIKFLIDSRLIERDGNYFIYNPAREYSDFSIFAENFQLAKNIFYDQVKKKFENRAFNVILMQEKLNETFENLDKYSELSSKFRTFYKKEDLYKKGADLAFEQIGVNAYEIYEVDNTGKYKKMFHKYTETQEFSQTEEEIKSIESVITLKEPAIVNSVQKESLKEKRIFAIFPIIDEEEKLSNLLLFGFDNRKLSMIKDYTLELIDGFSLNFKLTLKTVEMIKVLEDKVAARTAELKEAINKMKVINAAIDEKNKSKIKEIEIGANIQRTVVPDPKNIPKIGPLSIGAVWIAMPMKIAGQDRTNVKEVAGDFFNFYKISDEEVGIVIADASGHGIPAALLTMMASAAFSFNSRKGGTTAEICARSNQEVHRAIGDIGSYLTVFYLKVNLKTLEVEFTNAGHHYAIVYRRKTNTIEHWNTEGMFIGAFAEANYGFDRSKLEPGDKIVMYTDGFDESRNEEGEFFGEERIDDFLLKNKDLHPKEFAEKLYEELLVFCNYAPGWDDRTLVVIDVGVENLDDSSKHVILEKAVTYMNNMQFEKAEAEVLKYIKIHGESTEIYMQLGEVYFLEEQYDKAEKAFLKAKKLDPKDHKPLQALAKVAQTKKEYEKSAELSQEATRLMTISRKKKK